MSRSIVKDEKSLERKIVLQMTISQDKVDLLGGELPGNPGFNLYMTCSFFEILCDLNARGFSEW